MWNRTSLGEVTYDRRKQRRICVATTSWHVVGWDLFNAAWRRVFGCEGRGGVGVSTGCTLVIWVNFIMLSYWMKYKPHCASDLYIDMTSCDTVSKWTDKYCISCLYKKQRWSGFTWILYLMMTWNMLLEQMRYIVHWTAAVLRVNSISCKDHFVQNVDKSYL